MAEDKDFARRILYAGYRIIYDPNACVFHSHNFGLLTVFKRFFDYGVASKGIEDFNSSGRGSLRELLNYFLAETSYLRQNNERRWIVYSLMYESSKLIGFFLGKHGKYVPLFFKNRFSEMGSHGNL